MTDRFELLEEVGRGAMGVVWRARDNSTGKIVAVKMLQEVHADDPEYVERFAREVDLARQVRSPNIVRISGYGVRDGAPFVVLEFVAGSSLRAHLTEHGPIPPARARELLVQIAEALASVHAAGIIHRDVKASNVLVTEEGVAKLTDFGIAHSGDSKGITRKGSLIGTPAYLAPEGPIDARSDIYSLGVLYFEMLCGSLPFTSTSYQEVILAHLTTPPDLTRLPPGERQLAGWLLAKDPTARPQSAGALLASLQPGTVSATQPSAVPQPREPRPDPTPSLVPTATPVGSTSYRWAPELTRSRSADRTGTKAALAVGALAVLVLCGVFILASGGSGTAAASASSVTALTADVRPTSSGSLSALLVVVVLAIGAIAVTETVSISRRRIG
jgi:serine/threonine protein kinase